MTVIDLEGRAVQRLALELEARIGERGALVADIKEVGDVGRWRKAARVAGRNLGQPVRTMVSSDRSTVYAVLNRPVERGELAEATQQVVDFIFGPKRHLRLLEFPDGQSLLPYDE
jgi:hypothetical protein